MVDVDRNVAVVDLDVFAGVSRVEELVVGRWCSAAAVAVERPAVVAAALVAVVAA